MWHKLAKIGPNMDVAAPRAHMILSAILKKPVIYIMAGIKGGGWFTPAF